MFCVFEFDALFFYLFGKKCVKREKCECTVLEVESFMHVVQKETIIKYI